MIQVNISQKLRKNKLSVFHKSKSITEQPTCQEYQEVLTISISIGNQNKCELNTGTRH